MSRPDRTHGGGRSAAVGRATQTSLEDALDHLLDARARLFDHEIPVGLVLPWQPWVRNLPLELWWDSLGLWEELSVLLLMKSSLEP